jgi:hypothetical protein
MIERLKSEHRSFESKIAKVQDSINNDDIVHAAAIIRNMADKVTHHAVEEEARLMRVIMQKAKDESPESIRVMQGHNWVMNFLKRIILLLLISSFFCSCQFIIASTIYAIITTQPIKLTLFQPGNIVTGLFIF